MVVEKHSEECFGLARRVRRGWQYVYGLHSSPCASSPGRSWAKELRFGVFWTSTRRQPVVRALGGAVGSSECGERQAPQRPLWNWTHVDRQTPAVSTTVLTVDVRKAKQGVIGAAASSRDTISHCRQSTQPAGDRARGTATSDSKTWPANPSAAAAAAGTTPTPTRRDETPSASSSSGTWTISSGGRRRASCRRAMIRGNSSREILPIYHD